MQSDSVPVYNIIKASLWQHHHPLPVLTQYRHSVSLLSCTGFTVSHLPLYKISVLSCLFFPLDSVKLLERYLDSNQSSQWYEIAVIDCKSVNQSSANQVLRSNKKL